MESLIFQTVPVDSMWSLHGLHMDSSWSLWRLLELVGNAPMGFHGVLMEFPWTPHGLLMESMGSLCGVHRVFMDSIETRGGV